MTSSPRTRRGAILISGIAATFTMGVLLWRGPARPPTPTPGARPSVAVESAHTAPRGRRVDSPEAPAAESDVPLAAATVGSFAGRPLPPFGIPVGAAPRPRPLAQTASVWAADYRQAVCACKTRSCVGDLQAGFIRRLGKMAFSEERDGQAYNEATRQAIRCYAALPEDS